MTREEAIEGFRHSISMSKLDLKVNKKNMSIERETMVLNSIARNEMAIQALQAQAEKTCDLEKSNFSKEQYKLDTDTAYECGYNAGLQAQTDCNTCDKAVRDRVGVIGCAKFDSKPTVAIPHDGEYFRKKDVMGCIGQTSLHFELARKLKKLPTVAIPSAEPKWILTSERLPNVGQWVLVTTKDYQKYVEVMCYQGIRIGQHDIGNGWEEYEYPSWTSGHGDILGSHPEAWMPLPKPYESQEISARNLKMWEEIYAEEKRRERSEE